MRRSLLTALVFVLAPLALVACSEPPCHEDYQSCESTSECGAGGTCSELTWEFGSDSICSLGCESELDCPREGGRTGRCVAVGGSGDFRCYPECNNDSHCPEGWVCQLVSTGDAICLP